MGHTLGISTGTRPRMRRRLLLSAALVAAGWFPIGIAAQATDTASAPGAGSGEMEVRGTIDVVTPDSANSSTAAPTLCAPPTLGAARSSWIVEGITPGAMFWLAADAGSWNDDFDIAFFDSMPSCQAGTRLRHRNHAGDEKAVVPADAALAMVTLAFGKPPASFTYRELPDEHVPMTRSDQRRPTVVAVLEPRTALNSAGVNGYTPYHADFLGSEHPWNNDRDTENNLDFAADPAGYLEGYPTTAEPVQLTLPTHDQLGMDVSGLDEQDAPLWNAMLPSTAANPHVYRLTGTKIIGALRFGTGTGPGSGSVFADANAHGSRSAASAAGNVHGTCPECLFVVIAFDSGAGAEAIKWVGQQRWIDVITNSWGSAANVTAHADIGKLTHDAVERGQTVVFAAGNGAEGQFIIPNTTYTSSLTGADWAVTVGATASYHDQSVASARPVDISSEGIDYPSSGGTTANGTGFHAGTSNAGPVIAGTFAKVIQHGRDLLGDVTPGHDAGVVATGKPQPCPAGVAFCPLDDGVLRRAEVQRVVYENVLPTPTRAMSVGSFNEMKLRYGAQGPLWSQVSYISQGHGVLHGRIDAGRFAFEQRRLFDALRGEVAPYLRPPAEQNWMKVDSKCRQHLWGSWTEGYYKTGDADPTFDPTVDQPAMLVNAACPLLPSPALKSMCVSKTGTAGFTVCTPGD